MNEFVHGKTAMKQVDFQIKLGQQIAKLRKQKQFSQVEFAYMIDKEKQNLNKIEKGKTNPTSWTMYKISELLEVSIAELFDF